MARVNVEQVALSDTRFQVLGGALHVPADFAQHAGLGVMAEVWNHMTERWSEQAGAEAYCIDREDLARLIFGGLYVRSVSARRLLLVDRASKALIQAGLAEETEFGLRIRGTYGRIEWLNRRREAARINGKRGGRKPNSANPPSPAPSLAPARDKRRSEVAAKSARVDAPSGGANAHTLKAEKGTDVGSEMVPDSERPGKMTEEEWEAGRPVYAEGFAELHRISLDAAAKKAQLELKDAMQHVANVPELERMEDPAETLRRLAGLAWPKPLEDRSKDDREEVQP